MADQLDLSSLFPGMDPAQLQGLLAQFLPSAEDKKAAQAAWMQTVGASLIGSKKGQGLENLSRGLLGGQATYNGTLEQGMKQRGQAMTQALAAYKLGQEAQFDQTGLKLLNGGGGSAQGGGGPEQLGGPGMGAPDQSGGGMQPQGGAGGPGNNMPWATPRNELAFALMKKKDVADVIHRQMGLTQGPNGTLLGADGTIRGQVTGQGMVLFDGSPQGKFIPLPKEATDAMIAQKGGEAGATEAATQAARAPYEMIQVPDGRGGSTMMPKTEAMRRLGGGADPSQPPQFNFTGTPPANEIAAVQRDIASRQGGPLGTTPDPLKMKRAEGDIATQVGQDAEIAKGFGSDYLNAVKAEATAPANIQKYERMKNMYSQIETGKLAPTVMNLKAVAAYAFPDLAKTWTKDVPYAQAVSAMANAMALEMRNPAGGAGMPGSLSDADRKYLQSMISSMENDPRAIPMVLDAKIALEQRNRDMGKLARQYRSQTGKIDEGFYQAAQNFSDQHPLFPDMPNASAPAQAAGAKQVKSEADYNALPKGAIYTAPDGQQRRKQ